VRSTGPSWPDVSGQFTFAAVFVFFVGYLYTPQRLLDGTPLTSTAALPELHGWTLYVSKRAKHTAVARQWPEQPVATLTLVEEYARISRHLLGRGRAALGARNFAAEFQV
jgi:hypothetical protein